MANANNERSNDIRENVFNDAEKYYEQKYLQILKIQEQLMGSEHEKLLKDENFLDRTVWLRILSWQYFQNDSSGISQKTRSVSVA